MPDDVVGGSEKRLERRVPAALPVTVEDMAGAIAVTRDVSASGLFFETDAALAPGTDIHLTVELETPAGRRILKCHGSIVRTETLDNRLGCAVKILDSQLVRPH